MKYLVKHFCLLILLLSDIVFAQTGINTISPNASSSLDIFATDKGVLLPQYELTTLTSSITPVNNPVVGSLIYNTGKGVSTQIKGNYYWSGSSWERLVANAERDQILKVGIANNATTVIPSGTANNIVSFESTSIINTIPSVVFAGGTNINLPVGSYRIDITLDCSSPASTFAATANFISGNHLYVNNAAFVDTSNILLTDRKLSSNISTWGGASIQAYKFSFILTLATAQVVRLMLNHNDGSSATDATLANQSGLVVTFYKFL
jgi:hypothetical protein